MTRAEFLAIAKADGIRLDAFNLNGEGDECYVLADRGGSWDLYYSERGIERHISHFSAESAALSYLLEALRADPSTRC